MLKRKNITPLLLVSGLLMSCGNASDSGSSAQEYKNPLNNYEQILVKKSVLENMLNLSSVQMTYKLSQDDEKLYASSGSKAYTREETTSSLTTAIYSNKVIVSNKIYSSSTSSSGIIVKDSYELKSMTAVLENPDELIESGSITTEYGLYQKNFYKASSGKEFGVTYSLINKNFAGKDDVDYKWNNYILSEFDTISSLNYSLFRDDKGNVEALYSTSEKSYVKNAVYPYDSTKSVASIKTNVSSLAFNNINDGYQLKSISTTSDTDYLADYFGNALENGNVYHSETTSSYSYSQTAFAGIPFEANEYWELYSSTPVLETYLDNELKNEYTFTNITRDYQQTYGTDSFAFELTYTPMNSNYTYDLTNMDKDLNQDPKKFTVSSSAKIKINDDNSFSFLETNVAYRLLVILDTSYKVTSVSISLA